MCWRLAGEGEWSHSHVTRLRGGSMLTSAFCLVSHLQEGSLGFDGPGGSNRLKMEAARLPVIWTWSDLTSV